MADDEVPDDEASNDDDQASNGDDEASSDGEGEASNGDDEASSDDEASNDDDEASNDDDDEAPSDERLEQVQDGIDHARKTAEDADVLIDPDEPRFYESGDESDEDDQSIAPPG